jgi:hypothetical protein
MRSGVFVLPLLAACCSKPVPADPLTYVSRVMLADTPRAREPDFRALPDTALATVRALDTLTGEVVGSAGFKVFLEDVDALLAKASANPISGRRFLTIYRGLDPAYEPLHICYRVAGGGGSETARSGFSQIVSPCNAGGKIVVDITLRSITLDRASSKVREANACAVNTLAHEWAHAIANTDAVEGHHMVFEDNDHDHQSGPVASYLVGALAQCLYLASVNGGTDRFDVRHCVEVVGTNAFNPASCVGGWAPRFVKESGR